MTQPLVKAFWDVAQMTNDVQALSGHTLFWHLTKLMAWDAAQSDGAILCIGIGTGEWVNELRRRNQTAVIDALDISEHAFPKLDAGIGAYTAEQFYALAPADKYDWILSFWVSPHMTDEELAEQARVMVRALKDGGVFAVQYNEPTGKADDKLWQFMHTTHETSPALASAGLYCRTRETLDEMICEAGGVPLRHAGYAIIFDGLEQECIRHIGKGE